MLKTPAGLRPAGGLPERPDPPGSSLTILPPSHYRLPAVRAKQNDPESLIGPYVEEPRSGPRGPTVNVSWEVGKLHHGRPVSTYSDEEEISGLQRCS